MKLLPKRIALISGANRGIGLEVSKQLARGNIEVLMGSRDPKKGASATAQLKAEGLSVASIPLDVTQQTSIDQAFELIVQQYGRLDILVNNAGILIDSNESSQDGKGASFFKTQLKTIRDSFETNTLGAVRLIQKFVPLMQKNKYGRIVNISSGMGQLSEMNGGWPGYRISKTALNAVTRIVAYELANEFNEFKDTNILVNSVCPGWVKTDMGGPEAELTPTEGADTIVWLANLPDGGPSGEFFRERQKIAW
jgi:NAD(P)-dependent dehydrogenase (short-subunit alcohol dehydrogenase family)